jgi:FkbM family methyltransferase
MKGIINFESIWRRSLKALDMYNKWLFWREQHWPTVKMKKMRELYAGFVNEGDLCFDIGANMGSRVASFLSLKAKVIAVEPQRICYIELQIIFKNKNVEVVPKGVGATNEIKDFYLADDSLISPFSTEWIKGQKTGHFKKNNWDRIEKVEIVTLDMLIQQYGTPDFIKIDTEGFELEVLKGLSKPVRALSFEYTLPHQKEKAIECIQLIDQLYHGKVSYNICRDEVYTMNLPQWLQATDFIRELESDAFNVDNFGLYGDIYAKKTGK